MATALVNLIVNHKGDICDRKVKSLEGYVNNYVSDRLNSNLVTIVAINQEDYFKYLKCLNLNHLKGVVITICHQDTDRLIAGSHSNRFYSLEISEKFSSLPVINVQVTDPIGLDSATFATGDIGLTKMFVDCLNSYYSSDDIKVFSEQIELIFEESV